MVLISRNLLIEQPAQGYRFSIEPFILSHFVKPESNSKVLDIGTGCGIIPLLLITKHKDLKITGIEIQKSLFQQAKKNIQTNEYENFIQIIHDDFYSLKENYSKEHFDLIVSNPPYRKKNSGRINPCSEKAIARHELSLSLSNLVKYSSPILKTTGKIILTYPITRRDEVIGELRKNNFFPNRILIVKGHKKTKSSFFVVEASKSNQTLFPRESELIILNEDGSYTETMQEIYASFNNSGWPNRFWEK